MALKINQEKIGPEEGRLLESICPFGAIHYENGKLDISAGCKLCRMCVRSGPTGCIEWQEEKAVDVDKSLWKGVAVYVETHEGRVHPVSLELIGKARELAAVIRQEVIAVIIGTNLQEAVNTVLSCGVDRVYVYEDPAYRYFTVTPYARAFEDFIRKVKPSSILVGASALGRSLAPKVASHLRTGLTADCTVLEMKENTDLIQIRPAFGGNIMAQIITPHTRPQFCTVRYKIFTAPEKEKPRGTVIPMSMPAEDKKGKTEVLSCIEKPAEKDISDAEVIVAVGRGLKKKDDIAMVQKLAGLLHAQLACTRPLVEAGWFDPKRQIGLSGRTVKPKLIVTLGISGSVQFAAGMRGSTRIIAVNSDPKAQIFDIAHICVEGDLYEIVPALIERARREDHV